MYYRMAEGRKRVPKAKSSSWEAHENPPQLQRLFTKQKMTCGT
jgi:hypothetical protein